MWSVISKTSKIMITSMINWLVEGKYYRKIPYFMGKSMVSCRFSLKSTHWYDQNGAQTTWNFLASTFWLHRKWTRRSPTSSPGFPNSRGTWPGDRDHTVTHLHAVSMERCTMRFSWENSLCRLGPFSLAMFVYQRVIPSFVDNIPTLHWVAGRPTSVLVVERRVVVVSVVACVAPGQLQRSHRRLGRQFQFVSAYVSP